MSWFTSIAGRAEQILNQLDEAAATSLKDAGLSTTPSKTEEKTTRQQLSLHEGGLSYEPIAQPTTTPLTTPPSRPISKPTSTSSSTWSSSPSSWSPPPSSRSGSVVGSKSFTSGRSQAAKDESLMEFLNSPSVPREKKKVTPASTPSEKRVKNRKSDTAINKGSHDNSKTSHDTSHDTLHTETPPILPLSDTPPSIKDTLYEATPTVISLQPSQDTRTTDHQIIEQPQDIKPAASVITQQIQVTNNSSSDGQINEENQRLREEIKSLTDELFTMKQQVGDIGRVEGQLRADINSLRTQCFQLEELNNRMKSQEDDLTSALEARDSQISILRTRLQESDELTRTLRQQLEESERRKDQFLQDVGKSNDAQNQALLTVKMELEQNKLLLEQEKENITRLKIEFEERESLWNKEREEMAESLSLQVKELQSQQIRYSECHTVLQSTKQELVSLRKEHNDYKVKATGILQAKERLIESLRSSSSSSSSTGTDIETTLEGLRTEKYQLQSQLVNSEQVILSLRTELQEIEDTHSMEQEQLLQQIKLIEEELERERNLHLTTQDDVIALQKEIDNLKDEQMKERATFMSTLRERDTTVEELTRKVTSGSDQSDSSKKYLEERLRELTESLIEKQTNLEILSSQHNSTKLQLERTESSLVEAQKRVPSITSPHTALELGGGEGRGESTDGGAGAQMRPMASILPGEGNPVRQRQLRRVRTTLDSVDRVGLRLAWVLRRYPYVRLFTFGYILLLHIWVMIVLFTYKPEVHDHE